MPGAWRVLSWPSKVRVGKRELLFWQAELCAEEDFGRPASGECHERHAEGGVTLRLEKVSGGGDEGLRVEGDQIGLVLVDLFLVGGVDSRCFLRGERQVAEALVGAVSASRQNRVIREGRCLGADVGSLPMSVPLCLQKKVKARNYGFIPFYSDFPRFWRSEFTVNQVW